MIIDAQKFIENITQNSTSTFQKIKDSSSVFNNTINPNNIKSSAFFQANGSLAYFNPSKFEKMEKILTESTTQDIEKPNLLSYSSVVERNEKWLQEKNKKQASLKKEKEEEEIKNCSFNPNSFTKGFRSASNSRISTLIRNSELSVFSTQRSFSSNQKNNNNNNNTRSIIDSKYGDFQQKKVFSNSKWYHHESYLKEFERKKEISNKKLCNSRNEKLN